jgi:hypothetical protein
MCFVIILFLLLSSSRSSDPSSTISIRPTVPRRGRENEISGISILIRVANSFINHPRARSRITDGILVLDEVRSKR